MSGYSRRTTCASRYAIRKAIWRGKHRFVPGLRHRVWWTLHNVVAHPVIGVSPTRTAIRFHDWTAHHLNQRTRYFTSPEPEIPTGNERAWRWHNIVGHVLIGLFPCEATFRFHDRTSEAMNIPDWV